MNPMGLLKIKPLFEKFTQDHPKLLMFFMAAADVVDKDSILEVTVGTSKGEKMKTKKKFSKAILISKFTSPPNLRCST